MIFEPLRYAGLSIRAAVMLVVSTLAPPLFEAHCPAVALVGHHVGRLVCHGMLSPHEVRSLLCPHHSLQLPPHTRQFRCVSQYLIRSQFSYCVCLFDCLQPSALLNQTVSASAVPLRQSVPADALRVVIATCTQAGSQHSPHGRCKGGVVHLLTRVQSPSPGPPAARQTLAAVAPRRCCDAIPLTPHTASHTAMICLFVHLVVPT